jgi:hypothetical protein
MSLLCDTCVCTVGMRVMHLYLLRQYAFMASSFCHLRNMPYLLSASYSYEYQRAALTTWDEESLRGRCFLPSEGWQ